MGLLLFGSRNMTTDQFVGLIRQLLPFVGGILTTVGFSKEESETVLGKVGEIIGPLATIVGLIWSYVANSKKSILRSASQMHEVKQVQLNQGHKDLADDLPENVVVRGTRAGDKEVR